LWTIQWEKLQFAMDISRLFSLLFFFIFSFLTQACNDSALKTDKLDGYWVLESALREGQATTTLEGSWLAFDTKSGSFTSNLPLGLGASEQFKIEKGKIIVAAPQPLEFDVPTMTDSTMQILFSTRGFSFDINLRKAQRPVNEPNLEAPVQ
jgi:hypothetical protein